MRAKLQVCDAVIRAKVIYGLESVQLNDSLKEQIYAFQLNRLRQILEFETSNVDSANSNEAVYQKANVAVNSWDERLENGHGHLVRKQITLMRLYYNK